MGDLVRDGRPAHEVGGEDQPPAVADRARGRAAAPARHRIADRRPAHAMTPALAANSRVSRSSRSSACALQPAQQPALEPFAGPPGDQPPLAALDPPRPRRVPVEPVRQRRRAGRSRPARAAAGAGMSASAASIQARCSAAQARALRRETPPRHGQQHRAGARIDAEPHPPRARRHLQRRPASPPMTQLRAHGRPDDVRDRRLRPRRPSSRAPTCRRGAPSRGRR